MEESSLVPKKNVDTTMNIVPTPAPRAKPRTTLLSDPNPSFKRPIPAPRTLIPIRQTFDEDHIQSNDEIDHQRQDILSNDDKDSMMDSKHQNTFGRRVRTISNASLQLADDIKREVTESLVEKIGATRESVRKITKKFKTVGSVIQDDFEEESKGPDNVVDGVAQMFNAISFNSPMNSRHGSEVAYENADITSPPPTYPPPPLRPGNPAIPSNVNPDEIYDEPASVISGGSSSYGSASEQRHLDVKPVDNQSKEIITADNVAAVNRRENYESVFPAEQYNSDAESCLDLTTAQTIDRNVNLQRCDSWNFYDPLPRPVTENIYNNVDSTPTLRAISPLTRDDKTPVLSSITDNADISLRDAYENHEISRFKQPLRTNLPTESILLQFDPLSNRPSTLHSSTNYSSDLHSLAELLDNDLYGHTFNNNNPNNLGTSSPGRGAMMMSQFDEDVSILDDSEEDLNSVNGAEMMLPPLPPERVDSLLIENGNNESSQGSSGSLDLPDAIASGSRENVAQQKTAKIREDKDATPASSLSRDHPNRGSGRLKPSLNKWLTKVNEGLNKATVAFKKAPDLLPSQINRSSSTKSTDASLLSRPTLLTKTSITQRGLTFRVNNGTSVEDFFSELNTRWSVLSTGVLVSYADAQENNIKEMMKMEDILSVGMINETKYKHDNEELFCLEVNVWNRGKPNHVYGVKTMPERRVWMQKLAECMTSKFSSSLTSDYLKFGWAYISEGVSGQWVGAWLLLSHRKLHYAVDKRSVKTLDLRTARCIVLSPLEAIGNTPKTHDKGPNMIVDCTAGALYVRMYTKLETKAWCRVIRQEAHRNGAKLDQQQLTKNDIPVIIEKCINFIYVNGSMCEGIYRKAGNNLKVAELLEKFAKDAWAVQLTTENYSENDVATALKRFFRDLPEPLFPNDQRKYLIEVSHVKSQDERIRMYKAALEQLPSVTYKTIRKLLGHLTFIGSQSSKNLMNIDNLSAIWGPSLMLNDPTKSQQEEIAVVSQLITLCSHIFPENGRTAEIERVMLSVLQRCNNSPQGAVNVKTSGDFRMWIYIHNKNGKSHNIAIGPQRTAYEVICELSTKIDIPVHQLVLEEWILGEHMIRPIHHREKVLNVVLKWGYWDEQDRKDNCLIITKLNKYAEYMDGSITSPMAELRFADSKSKNFKPFMFEFTQATLKYFKDRYSLTELSAWNIEDIVWYLGHEPKRNPPSKYTVTFITKNGNPPKRSKTEPFFGNCLAWITPAERALWLRMFLHAEHPTDLTPPPQHVNLMSS